MLFAARSKQLAKLSSSALGTISTPSPPPRPRTAYIKIAPTTAPNASFIYRPPVIKHTTIYYVALYVKSFFARSWIYMI